MKNFNIFGVQWKIRLLGGLTKNQYRGGGLPNKGGLAQFADLRGGLGKKDRVVFLRRGFDTPKRTMKYTSI